MEGYFVCSYTDEKEEALVLATQRTFPIVMLGPTPCIILASLHGKLMKTREKRQTLHDKERPVCLPGGVESQQHGIKDHHFKIAVNTEGTLSLPHLFFLITSLQIKPPRAIQ